MNTCIISKHHFIVFAKKTTLAVDGACGQVNAYELLGGCAHALLGMRVNAYFFSAICNERGHLLVLVTFVGLLVIAFVIILSPLPLPIPSHATLGQTSPVSSFPVEDH